ncbi:hypothetical protein [Streptomyces sp. NPDC127098]|uniref:hypothetical protein n=1 Tax=Streptomyces sp. NPDC127098 TaxID=3347137 RepID=UPI00365D2A6E
MDVTFTRADVEAASSAKPWTHREEFAAEVDTDHMADTASIFARAARGAETAGELSQRATEIGKQAGALNGAAFVEDDRVDETAAGLQGNGEGIDRVVRMLVRAMNHATDTREEVDAQIDGGGGKAGMQQILERNSTAAVRTWGQAQQFFASQPVPAVGLARPALASAVPRFLFNNVEYEGVLSGNAWTPPPNLPTDIRESYLNMTADEAHWADEEITDAIRQYRQKLAEYGTALEEAGFDTSQGPLGIWRSDEMAAFNAAEVKRLLAEGNPDPELLARYTSGLNSVAEDVDAKDGDKTPTPEQQAYLNAFFRDMSTDDLLGIGRLGDSYKDFRSSVANGVIAASTGPEPLSQVREFFEDKPISDQGKDGRSVRLQAERFDEFGALLSHSTITPNENFSTSLINAAIDARKDYQSTSTTFALTPLEGADTFLSLAARNEDAAATFLSDKNQIGRLLDPSLSSSWADGGRAVGDLMRAGTLPEGETFTAAEANRLNAGHTLMQYVADNADDYVDNRREFAPGAADALTNIAGNREYLNRLSAVATAGPDEPPVTRSDGFPLSANERSNLFSVLLDPSRQNAEAFRSQVGDYIEHRARSVFEGAPGTGTVPAEIRQLGQLSGAVTNAELAAAYREDKRSDEVAKQSYQAVKTGLSIAGEWNRATAVVDGASNLVSEPEPTAERNDELRRYWENRRGDTEELQRIYDVARRTGYEGMDDTPAGRIIPYNGEKWDLDPQQWEQIGTSTGRNQRQAITDALGPLSDHFHDERVDELGREGVENDYDGQQEVSEVTSRGDENWRSRQ